MSKKKASKSAFYDPAGGFFSQKKKVIHGNIKHSGDKRNISLSKSGSGDNVYSDVKSLSGDYKNVSMSNVNDGFLLGLAATTPKAKQINTGAVFGFPLIIKTPVEVSVKKLFALDINLSAVEKKSAMAKTQLIRKNFSSVNGFGRATTLLKFEGIIQSTFTSKKNIEMVASLARKKRIDINSNLKKQEIRLDQTVIIKKILMNTPKEMIITALAKFDLVCVAIAMGDHNIWASRDQFRALLFTLPVRTTAHDLGILLDRAGEKTYIINCLLNSGNQVHCAVVGFEFEEDLESAYYTELIFGGIKLSWTRLDLVCCKNYGCFDHSTMKCNATTTSNTKPLKLNGVKLVPLVPAFKVESPIVPASVVLMSDAYMILDISLSSLPPSSSDVEGKTVDLGLSSSKVLTSKVGGLEFKMIALEVSISSILGKLDLLCVNTGFLFADVQVFITGLDVGFCGVEVAVIMDNSLARHVSKVKKISGHLISVCFLFRNKLLVTILDLYADVSASMHFGQAANINSMVSRAVNSSSFVVLGSNFNENKSKKNASFRFCLDLSLVNTFNRHALANAPTWDNSRGAKRVIDFIFVSGNLVSAVALHIVNNVSRFFDTDHKLVLVSIGLGGLLDTCLISAHKQAN
ncbi:hypothetical protein G9A89_012365 [Geosiphon pyriformis]|nr:hypothetical protein G9A89_012365 [Geosiphon pyriformis]